MDNNTRRSTNVRSNRDTLVRCANCGSFIDSINSAVIVWRVILDDGHILYTDHSLVHDSSQCKNNVFKKDHFLWKLVSTSFQNGKLNFDRLFDRKQNDKFHQVDENSIKMIMPSLHRLLRRWSYRIERVEAMRLAALKATEEKARMEKIAAAKWAAEERARADKVVREQAAVRKDAEEKIRVGKKAEDEARSERLAAENFAAKRIAVMKLLAKKEAEEKAKRTTDSSKSRTRAGYVYLLQSPTGYYKIGRTKNPSDRIKTFSVKLPFEVEYIIVISTFDMVQLETDLHHKYANKRIDGEWFELSSADVAYIKGLAG